MVKVLKDMSDGREISLSPQGTHPRFSEFRYFWHVFTSRAIVVFGLIVVFATILVAIFAPFIAPYDPYKVAPDQSLMQPSRQHILGTDILGRDTLSRVIYGSRISLIVGIFAVGMGALTGILLGLIAGYMGGIIQTVIMRIMDAIMSIPPVVLAMTIALMLGGGLRNIIIAFSVSMMPLYARLTCGMVLSAKEQDYIIASRSIGSGTLRIMLRHVLPNCFPPLIVAITMQIGMIMLGEAALSFLGVGIQPPSAAWGSMVNEGYKFLLTNPVLSFAPGLAVVLVVFAVNMVGDGLRDAFDPRFRGMI
jgi:peptide/nickel transport system permease protein